MPVLTIGIVRDCSYLRIFYSEKFSAWVWRLAFAVLENLSDKSQNQEILSTFSMPYACVSSFRHFFGQISLPFHKLQLVKSPPFYIREAWKWYPFLGGASLCGPVKGVRPLPPPDDLKARTDWILVSIYWFVHTCFALFASSARSSGSITDVLDLQTLQRENGSVLSVKTRWNNREEEDDINELCSVFQRCAVNGGSCDPTHPLCRMFGQLLGLHVRDLLWVAWLVLCDPAWRPGFWTIAWCSKTLNYEREHIINFYGFRQLRGLFWVKGIV